VQKLRDQNGASAVVTFMHCLHDGTRRRAERMNLIRNVRYSDEQLSTVDQPRKAVVEDITDKPKESDKPAGETCGLCNKGGHTMNHCLLALEGDIPGCVLCNTTEHELDSCAKYMEKSIDEKLILLIRDRAGLPPLWTSNPWEDVLHV
jgi:hypothetical protein